ncbi:hypothetical protein BG005_005804 [Podila minutissima]|nr:hypothetical protein BG005_005804 [Podila minutissima]
MHGGRRGGEDQEAQQQQPHEAEESTETAPQDEQDLQQPHILSIKKRVASGQVQLDHYCSMISQLEQQSSVFVQQQQELKERRDHVARAVESLENKSSEEEEEEKQEGKKEEEDKDKGREEEEEEGPSLWSSSSSHTPTKAVVLHSHDVGDAEKDDTDDMFVHPVVPDKRSSYPGPTSQATFSPSSPPNSADSNTSRNSRDDLLFKADCERCILKDELLHKRGALQQIQGEIERLQQRLNSCASQVRMIQRTFVGPIEQHLAMDQSELGRIERAIVKSA